MHTHTYHKIMTSSIRWITQGGWGLVVWLHSSSSALSLENCSTHFCSSFTYAWRAKWWAWSSSVTMHSGSGQRSTKQVHPCTWKKRHLCTLPSFLSCPSTLSFVSIMHSAEVLWHPFAQNARLALSPSLRRIPTLLKSPVISGSSPT